MALAKTFSTNTEPHLFISIQDLAKSQKFLSFLLTTGNITPEEWEAIKQAADPETLDNISIQNKLISFANFGSMENNTYHPLSDKAMFVTTFSRTRA